MAIAPVTTWLRSADKNYQLGVALYEQYGTKPLLKALFRNGSSDYHHNRLTEALEELNQQDLPEALPATRNSQPAIAFIPALPSIPVPKRHGLSDPDWEKAPDQIKDLYTENSRLKSRADMLYIQVRSARTAAERLQLALAMLDDRDQLKENWKAIKEYHATGQLQEQIRQEQEKPVAELPVSELLKLSRNLPTYITKDTKKLENLKPGTMRDKALKRLAENTIKLQLVKERMANV